MGELTRRLLDLPRVGLAVVTTGPAQLAALWDEVGRLVGRAGALVGRLDQVLDRVDLEVSRVQALLTRVETVAGAATDVVAEVRTLLGEVGEVLDGARGAVGEARDAVGGVRDVTLEATGTRALAEEQVERLRALLDAFEPSLQALVPTVAQVARELDPRHVAGVAALLDRLPVLVERIEPALTSMAGLAPELEQVTERMDNVGQVVEGLPGAKVLRRRGQAREAAD